MSATQDQKAALLASLRDIVESFRPIALGERILPGDALFAYRMLLGRMPSTNDEVANILSVPVTYREFLSGLLESEEFSKKARFLPGGLRLMTESNGFRLWFDSSDRDMGSSMACGGYEQETVGLLKQIVSPGMVCLDVGAQIGFFTCLLAQLVGPTGRVFAFEPLPASFELLQRNVAENHYVRRTELKQVACASKSGKILADVKSRMVVASRAGNTSIDAVALDEIIDSRVHLCKIDVEGHEPGVIEGMAGILRRNQPIILTEFNNYWLREAGSSIEDYAKLLRSFGYELWTIDGSLSRFDETRQVDILANFNVVAVGPRGPRLSGT